ncbi:MAG: hypothetical protein GTN36_03220 [Candidatus Aenigmarchaeota archaeon]|nr:hypothetical protein [Candidatus Aenigmarchaeota archaeon]
MVKKGFVKTLEAGIAIALILVSMVFLFPGETETEPQISDTGYNCLRYLDYEGVLRNYAANSLESDLISDLRKCVPPILNYTARICTSTSCNTELPTDKTIFLSSYLIAGEAQIDRTLINLWVWSK